MAIEPTQKLSGTFNLSFWGIILFFVSKATLTQKEGTKSVSAVDIYTLHITPFFAVGIPIPRKIKDGE